MSEEAKDDVQQVKRNAFSAPWAAYPCGVCVPAARQRHPEDKLKALIDLDAQQGKLCA